VVKKLLAVGLSLGMFCAITTGAGAAELSRKKLQIFILAGQSNMVGHANYITIPALLTAEEPGVKKLSKLIFKEGAIVPGLAKDQIETRIKCDNYKNNMIAFVKDVRKEYKVPNMPFVIGVMGTGVTKEGVDKNAVSVAQRKAAAAPEFKGSVAGVESYPFYAVDAFKMFRSGEWIKRLAEASQIMSDRPYHYMGSGKFFVRFGDALAASMVDLMSKQK